MFKNGVALCSVAFSITILSSGYCRAQLNPFPDPPVIKVPSVKEEPLKTSPPAKGTQLPALPSTSPSQSLSLPSVETQNAIKQLTVESKPRRSQSVPLSEYVINKNQLPAGAADRLKLDAQGNASTPLLVPNTVVLQFEPTASKADIESLLTKRGLTVVDTYPSLGAVKAEGDLSRYFTPTLNDRTANDTLLRGATNVIDDFKSEPIVRSATPDVVLTTKAEPPTIANLVKATEVAPIKLAAGETEKVDWGIEDIEANKLWSLSGAFDGALLGVMDVGFSRHEDITFLELANGIEVDDHGNHVAGIACARHGNGKGVQGVIPNCFVRAKTADVFFTSAGGNPTLGFLVVFSQVLASFDRFLSDYTDLKVINLSMGYNWRSNFGINPDAPESDQWRKLVEAQGVFLVSVLELANKSGKVIVSAAGNDSTPSGTPIKAKYASPFNWAAIAAREKNIRNGLIVEAHDQSKKRAYFSNSGGHISCPGVNVLSTVAKDAQGSVSDTMYGTMSGTSMASPYCASALVLLGLVRPGYTGVELLDCMIASSDKTDAGTPMLKLTQAVAKCPPKLIQ